MLFDSGKTMPQIQLPRKSGVTGTFGFPGLVRLRKVCFCPAGAGYELNVVVSFIMDYYHFEYFCLI